MPQNRVETLRKALDLEMLRHPDNSRGQGSSVFVGVGGWWLDITLLYHISFLSPSLREGPIYRVSQET